MQKLPDRALLLQLLDYAPETGKLTWRHRPLSLFVSHKGFKCWNGKHAGKEAFTSIDNHGYRQGQILTKHYKVHRLIWLIHHGVEPDGYIDHINQDRSDNRIANLRVVTKLENHRNMKRKSNNTSGHNGVFRSANRWQASITVNRESIYLGRFTDIAEAVAARKAAEAKYGFHRNHGS